MGELLIAVLAGAACVFGASAAMKLRSREAYLAFRTGLGQTALVRPGCLPIVARLLVVAEASAATALAAAVPLVAASLSPARLASLLGLAISGAVAAVLTIGVAVVIGRGVQAPCACFGTSSGRALGGAHLVRNCLLLAGIGTGLLAACGTGEGRVGAGGGTVAMLAGIIVALPLIGWEDLMDLFWPMPGRGEVHQRISRAG